MKVTWDEWIVLLLAGHMAGMLLVTPAAAVGFFGVLACVIRAYSMARRPWSDPKK